MPDDLERLSAYLDNALSAADRSALEARLADDEALRTELDLLRQTVQTLRNAPELAAPRNFTLDPAKYRRAAPWWTRYQRMQLLATLGTAAAVVLIAAGVLLSNNSLGSPAASTGAGVALQPTTAVVGQTEADKANEQSTRDAAARSSVGVTSTAVLSSTPLPSATAESANLFALPTTATSIAAEESTTQQAGQDGAGAASDSSVTATETFAALSASQPMMTATTAPPALAATSVFKSATSMPTAGYSPIEATRDMSADSSVGGSVAPVAPPTILPVLPTAGAYLPTQPPTDMQATPIALGTPLPPSPILATVTLAPIANAAPTENLPVTDTITAPTATVTLVPPQPSQPVSGSLPFLIIIGIPLLVFSLMMLAIIWIRSRMR